MSKLDYKRRASILRHEDSNNKTPYQLTSSTALKNNLDPVTSIFYFLPSQPEVLVIYSTDERHGAELECHQLCQALWKLQVNMTIKKNLTGAGIMEEIRKIQSKKEISAMIVIIMSHGRRGAIETTEGALGINQILLTMNSQRLEGKPKVVYLNVFLFDFVTLKQNSAP